jgi:hypothetical protein
VTDLRTSGAKILLAWRRRVLDAKSSRNGGIQANPTSFMRKWYARTGTERTNNIVRGGFRAVLIGERNALVRKGTIRDSLCCSLVFLFFSGNPSMGGSFQVVVLALFVFG